MKSRFLLGIEEIDVRYRSYRTNCDAIWGCHIPFCPEVKGMPSLEWLKIKEGKTSKMRVGAHLGPMLEILMGNLP